jgi:MFS family permease
MIIPLAAVFSGFQIPLYWLSYRSLFAREGILSDIGREVGLSAISTRFASIAGPALGGLVITFWGFSALFKIALFVVILSGIPFFFMPKHKHELVISFETVLDWLKNKKHRNEELSFLGRHIDNFIYAIFWPVFVYLILGSFEKQGMIASLSLVTSTVMVYVAGRVFDQKHSRNVFNLGVYVNSFMWILRGLTKNIGQLILVEASANALSPFYWITFESLMYERSREKGEKVIVFMVGRTLVVSLSIFLVLTVAFILASCEWRFWALWALSIMGTLSTLFMWEKKDENKKSYR